ncbi:hypothetical protein [Treponema brennaborense]|uniref:Uncharacterized protein n=1 Tax=Treponema brennaborense (strain DSM 12168 / CIP 105900 / DD5/3) TaxID=906968 RepID=F4LKC4_TREBD|nr:hypothetical protein [Treponema brennaborense]AEE16498.1 hypothetical protein Trebr_1066 [Treponema brennaborense DSM 12168]
MKMFLEEFKVLNMSDLIAVNGGYSSSNSEYGGSSSGYSGSSGYGSNTSGYATNSSYNALTSGLEVSSDTKGQKEDTGGTSSFPFFDTIKDIVGKIKNNNDPKDIVSSVDWSRIGTVYNYIGSDGTRVVITYQSTTLTTDTGIELSATVQFNGLNIDGTIFSCKIPL